MRKDLCALCGGEKEEMVTQIERWRDEKLYVFRKVKAKVCKKCGEIYIPAESEKAMEEKIRKAKPIEVIKVPVYAL
ncbi:YgiT-type zinc finger protein [candidate division WOR-3 bacterium]|nr:YgiT-type zinc finger protein [candidate division WOR-3 bacterium]